MSTDPPAAPAGDAPARAPQSTTAQRSNSFSAQSDKSENSQTAAEYVSKFIESRTNVELTSTSFIRDQEALEADAREALPYVCPPFCFTSTRIADLSVHRYLHQDPWTPPPKRLRLLDLQPSTRLSRPAIHPCGHLLCLLHPVPRRAHSCRDFPEAQFHL